MKKGAGKQALQKYVTGLEKNIRGTYRGSGMSISQSLENLAAQTTKAPKGMTRANYIFQQQVGAASNKRPSTLGKYGDIKVKIFYRATQRMWEGAPSAMRNKIIMNNLGVSSLAEAFNVVMSTQNAKEALQYAISAGQPIEDTAENMAFMQDVQDSTYSSPDYISMVNDFSMR